MWVYWVRERVGVLGEGREGVWVCWVRGGRVCGCAGGCAG